MGKKILLLISLLFLTFITVGAQDNKDSKKKDKPKKEEVYKSKEVMKEINTNLKKFQYAKAENIFY